MAVQLQSSVLFVENLGASRSFYEGLLGQTVVMDHGPNVGYTGGFALWQADHAWQVVYGSAESAIRRLGQRNFELYFETEDLDAAWERLAQAGVGVIHALREQPWGQRVFRVYDPDGHIVEVGEPMSVVVRRFLAQGLTIEEIAQRTFMPVNILQHIASMAAAEQSNG